MELSHYFSLVVPLGLAGFDPAPLFVALYYLAKHGDHAGRRTVLGFGLLILLGTVAWGLLLSLVFGDFISHLPWHEILHAILNAGIWTVLGKLFIAIALLIFGVLRLRKVRARGANTPEAEKPAKNRSASGLVVFALVFILVITTDVAFAAYVAASSSQPVWAQSLGLVGWSVISQFPLVFFLLALVAGKEAVFSRGLSFIRKRFGALISYAIPVACIALGMAFVLDVVLFPFTRFALLPFLHM